MSIWMIVAQTLGISAMIAAVVSMQCRSNRKFFMLQELSGILFTVSFVFMGAWEGALMNFFGTVRPELLRREKLFKSKWVLAVLMVFLALCICVTALITDKKWYLLFTVAIAQLVGTFFMWTQNGRNIRLAQLLFVSPLWILYNLLLPVPSIGGVMTELINITSVIVVLIRYRKQGFSER